MSKYNYTEGFKKKLVQEIESGKYKSADEAKKLLNIGGSMTIYKWIAKYGKNSNFVDANEVINKLNERLMENLKDNKVKELEKQLQEMQQANLKDKIELEFYKALVDIAKEDFKIDLKKKYGLEQHKE